MAAKKGKDKKAFSPTLTVFSDFEENCKPEPSPSYFTELPMEVTNSALRGGNDPSGDDEVSMPPMGVKLYFRPGLHTEAVKEGLQQALRHECTVVQIDLGCALQVRHFKIPHYFHYKNYVLTPTPPPTPKLDLLAEPCVPYPPIFFLGCPKKSPKLLGTALLWWEIINPPLWLCKLKTWQQYGIKIYWRSGQWRIQDFPQGGAPTTKIAIIFQIFAKNCMKMKEFRPPGGGGARPWRPPLDPPMLGYILSLLKMSQMNLFPSRTINRLTGTHFLNHYYGTWSRRTWSQSRYQTSRCHSSKENVKENCSTS